MRSLFNIVVSGIFMLALGCGVMVMSSCNTSKTTTTEARSNKSRKSSDPILDKFAGNFEYGEDASGNSRVKSDRRSRFEQKTFNAKDKTKLRKDYRVSDFKTKDYKTKDYGQTKTLEYGEVRENHQELAGLGKFRDEDQRFRGEDDTYKTGDYRTKEFREGDAVFKTQEDVRVKNNRYIRSEPVDNIVELENRQESFTFSDVKKMVGE